ncbi:MAG: NAD-dependent epimerase/dehydratase family protein [Leptospiraceae bacterium]|nr:NAD-dependent epimerase/dehydratase family protein [Leptospiraceae bacterium]
MKFFITGGAGFIGSHLTDRLLELGHEVTCYDNLSSSVEANLNSARNYKNFSFIKGDTLNSEKLVGAMNGHEVVIHLSALEGSFLCQQNPSRCIQQNTIASFNLLEAMKKNETKSLFFLSSAQVYGKEGFLEDPVKENCFFPSQTSIYAASKISTEAFMQAYSHSFDIQTCIFRTPTIIGERYYRGLFFDIFKTLSKKPDHIKITSSTNKTCSFLHVSDLVQAILLCLDSNLSGFESYNIALKEFLNFQDCIQLAIDELKLNPKIEFVLNPEEESIEMVSCELLSVEKIENIGWKAQVDLKTGIQRTMRYLNENKWLLE